MNEIATAIDSIAAKLGVAATEIIPHYTWWFYTSAIAWGAVGVVIIVIAVVILVQLTKSDEKILGLVFFCSLLVIGALFVASNIGNMVAPQGRAYHQLIKDIRSGE